MTGTTCTENVKLANSTMQRLKDTLECSSDRTFTIGSSDYTSFVVMPPLLEFSLKMAPSINVQMIEFEKDRIGDLLEQGEIDVALGVFPNPPRQTQWEPIFEERKPRTSGCIHNATHDGFAICDRIERCSCNAAPTPCTVFSNGLQFVSF